MPDYDRNTITTGARVPPTRWRMLALDVSVIRANDSERLRFASRPWVTVRYAALCECSPDFNTSKNTLCAGWYCVGDVVHTRFSKHYIRQVRTNETRKRVPYCRCGRLCRGASPNPIHIESATR